MSTPLGSRINAFYNDHRRTEEPLIFVVPVSWIMVGSVVVKARCMMGVKAMLKPYSKSVRARIVCYAVCWTVACLTGAIYICAADPVMHHVVFAGISFDDLMYWTTTVLTLLPIVVDGLCRQFGGERSRLG
ncbi:hypothetical protein JS532_04360 [Bifidobacterium callimiconis]|uniref:hypothetical protein n=1 Tax=Bifidobacterium callimiconis TaxID=2306973 RepID=UPI001BDBD24D|nr:hypothetical protein [Bifidobacterium callimiconis]MBT1176803.1 hypothetical protein [Bifidobacterium callimiconis]